jgi:hypothetical protein
MATLVTDGILTSLKSLDADSMQEVLVSSIILFGVIQYVRMTKIFDREITPLYETTEENVDFDFNR